MDNDGDTSRQPGERPGNKKILEEFDRQGVKHPISKLMVGDYMNYDNPRLIIDRKQSLLEVCSNV